jgi:amino acid transporter
MGTEQRRQREGAVDAGLDAGKTDDAIYLGQLGYRQELKRALGQFGSFAIQMSVIGVSIGLYLTFGYGLSIGGPLFIAAFVVGVTLQMFVGLSVAELVSAYPLAGGSYQIVNRIASKALAWQVGWFVALALIGAVAITAVGLAAYIGPWIGIPTPDTVQTLTIAGVYIAIITVINVVGIRFASIINNIGVVAEIFGLSTVLILLLVVGLLQPVSFLTSTGGTDAGGSYLLPFLFVLLMPAFIISSFDSTGHLGEETKNAAVAAPRGVLIANFASLIYAVIAIVVLLLSIPDLDTAMKSSTPIVYIVTSRLGSVVANLLTVVVVVSFAVNAQISELMVARIFWAQARDGQAPAAGWLRTISSTRSPANATVIVALMAFGFALYTQALSTLVAAIALLFALAYGITVAAGILAKRRGTLPKHPWNYGRWGGFIDVVAVIWSFFLCGVIIYQTPGQVGLGLAGVVAAGLLIYYVGIPRARRGVMQVDDTVAADLSAP